MQITLDDISLIAYDIAEITYDVCGIENAITDRFLAYISDFIFGEGDEEEKVMKKIKEKYNLSDIQIDFVEGSFEQMAFSICYLNQHNEEFLKRLKILRKKCS